MNYEIPPQAISVDEPYPRPVLFGYSLPTKAVLEYTKEFITTALLVMALPWILRFLFSNPSGFAKVINEVTP